MKEYPKTFEEAMNSSNATFERKKVNDEMDSIVGNNTWKLMDLLQPVAHILILNGFL